jgi:hypothetical protein
VRDNQRPKANPNSSAETLVSLPAHPNKGDESPVSCYLSIEVVRSVDGRVHMPGGGVGLMNQALLFSVSIILDYQRATSMRLTRNRRIGPAECRREREMVTSCGQFQSQKSQQRAIRLRTEWTCDTIEILEYANGREGWVRGEEALDWGGGLNGFELKVEVFDGARGRRVELDSVRRIQQSVVVWGIEPQRAETEQR